MMMVARDVTRLPAGLLLAALTLAALTPRFGGVLFRGAARGSPRQSARTTAGVAAATNTGRTRTLATCPVRQNVTPGRALHVTITAYRPDVLRDALREARILE